MKLKSTMNKLPLITLLALGLVCSPLIVSASDGDRGRHGHYQQNHGKHHQKIDHHRSYRDYGHHQNYGHKNSYRKDYKHGYKSGHHNYRPYGHYGHYVSVQRHYRDGHHYERPLFFLGLFSDD